MMAGTLRPLLGERSLRLRAPGRVRIPVPGRPVALPLESRGPEWRNRPRQGPGELMPIGYRIPSVLPDPRHRERPRPLPLAVQPPTQVRWHRHARFLPRSLPARGPRPQPPRLPDRVCLRVTRERTFLEPNRPRPWRRRELFNESLQGPPLSAGHRRVRWFRVPQFPAHKAAGKARDQGLHERGLRPVRPGPTRLPLQYRARCPAAPHRLRRPLLGG